MARSNKNGPRQAHNDIVDAAAAFRQSQRVLREQLEKKRVEKAKIKTILQARIEERKKAILSSDIDSQSTCSRPKTNTAFPQVKMQGLGRGGGSIRESTEGIQKEAPIPKEVNILPKETDKSPSVYSIFRQNKPGTSSLAAALEAQSQGLSKETTNASPKQTKAGQPDFSLRQPSHSDSSVHSIRSAPTPSQRQAQKKQKFGTPDKAVDSVDGSMSDEMSAKTEASAGTYIRVNRRRKKGKGRYREPIEAPAHSPPSTSLRQTLASGGGEGSKQKSNVAPTFIPAHVSQQTTQSKGYTDIAKGNISSFLLAEPVSHPYRGNTRKDTAHYARNVTMRVVKPPLVASRCLHLAYYDLSIPLKASTDPKGEMCSSLKAILKELWIVDPTIKIFPFKAHDRLDRSITQSIDSISSWNQATNDNLLGIQKYTPDAFPLYKGGKRSTRVLMGSSLSYDQIRKNLEWWLEPNKYGIYVRSLQSENTRTVGWAYMSTEKTDKKLLAEQLQSYLRFPVGLQWRAIFTGGPVPEDLKVRALHFEVEETSWQADSRALQDLYYHTKTEGFPLGIRLRFVPLRTGTSSQQDISRLNRIVNKQRAYNKYIHHFQSWDIPCTEETTPSLGNGSLRQLIMSLTTKAAPFKPLFTAVNREWQNNGYIFSCVPQHRPEAFERLAGLLCFLRAHMDPTQAKDLDRLFSVGAIERADESVWDAINGCAVTPESNNLSGVDADPAKVDVDFDFTNMEQNDTNETAIPNQQDYLSLTDTIGTIGSGGRNTSNAAGRPTYAAPKKQDTTQRKGKNTTSNASKSGQVLAGGQEETVTATPSESTLSGVTLEDKVSDIESRLDDRVSRRMSQMGEQISEKLLNDMQSLLLEHMNRLTSTLTSQVSAPGAAPPVKGRLDK